MLRRITSIGLVLSVLMLALVLSVGTAAVQAQTLTATPTRTSTAVVCSPMPPTYYTTVTSSATSVNVGDQITVTVRSNVGIATYRLTVIDNATGVAQSASDPIFTPAAPTAITPPGAVYIAQWTLTAVRAGSVTFSGSTYGEVQVCSAGNLYYTYGGAAGQSGTVTVGGVVPTLTPTPFVAGDLGYGTVSGKVTNASNGAAIAGATVTCGQTSYNTYPHCTGTTSTDSAGNYSFANVFFHDTDTITVSVAAAGYVSQSFTKPSFTTAGMTANFALVANGPTFTPTATPTITRTPTRTLTPTRTPTVGAGTCSPVSATITAPFTKDGAGTFCWQSSNLGAYINSWNTTSVTINGTNITNLYVASGSYPAKIGGFWYVAYNSAVAWGHFEAK